MPAIPIDALLVYDGNPNVGVGGLLSPSEKLLDFPLSFSPPILGKVKGEWSKSLRICLPPTVRIAWSGFTFFVPSRWSLHRSPYRLLSITSIAFPGFLHIEMIPFC